MHFLNTGLEGDHGHKGIQKFLAVQDFKDIIAVRGAVDLLQQVLNQCIINRYDRFDLLKETLHFSLETEKKYRAWSFGALRKVHLSTCRLFYRQNGGKAGYFKNLFYILIGSYDLHHCP